MDINAYVGAVWTACDKWSTGYGQGDGTGGRWDIRDGGSGDCSSVAIWGAQMGGYPTAGASSTHDMIDELTSVGWSLVPAGYPSKGDILWKPGHVSVAIADGTLAEAWINELGEIVGGEPGDQTNQETRVVGYWEHPFTGQWEWIIRPPASYPAGGWSMELPMTPTAVRPPAQPRRPGGSIAEPQAWQNSAPSPSAPQGGPLDANGWPKTWGVDISNHQPDYDIEGSEAEFIIILVNYGSFINPLWRSQALRAWRAGKRVGLYSFVLPSGNSVDNEVQRFLSEVEEWQGYALFFLDWEDTDIMEYGPGAGTVASKNVAWALEWLQKVEAASQTKPWIYMNVSTANGANWESVAANYDLWVAGYAGTEWDAPFPYELYSGWQYWIWQYTTTGDTLDKNRAWISMAEWDYLTKNKARATGKGHSNTIEEDDLSAATDTVNTISSLLHDHLAPAIGQMARESYATNARTEKMAADIAAMRASIEKLTDTLTKKEN